MKNAICTAILFSLALGGPASAHHSYAMFDNDKDVALTGIVKDWQWTNPHTLMVLDVPGDQGKVIEYTLEGQSPQVLRLRGWNRGIVKPGDKVTVHVHPLRDGSTGGSLMGVIAADGHNFNLAP